MADYAYMLGGPPYVIGEMRGTIVPMPGKSGQPLRWGLPEKGRLPVEDLMGMNTTFRFDDPVPPGQPLDFLLIQIMQAVSGRVKELIEELDGVGRHEFVVQRPVGLPRNVDTKFYKDFFLIRVPEADDCIDPEASKLVHPFRNEPELMARVGPAYAPTEAPLFCKPGWRPSHHLWRDEKYLKSYLFISEELKTRLEQINAGPVVFRPVQLT